MNFAEWDYELFLSLCVLSGCDFLDNIKGLGIKKMYNILNKHRDVDTAFKALRSDAKTREIIPDGYEEKWRQARLIFKHALVYDIFDKSLRHLTPLGEDVASQYDDLSFLGPVFDDVEARRIAEGELNPISRQKFIQSPPAAAKTSTNGGKFQFGAKRKQGRAEAGTNAQRSLMMNFFTKLVPTSPLRKKPAPEPAVPSGRRRRRRYFTRRRPSRDRRDRSRVRHHPTANDIRVRASEPTENDQFPHQPLFAEQKVSLKTAFAQSFAPRARTSSVDGSHSFKRSNNPHPTRDPSRRALEATPIVANPLPI